MYMLERLIFSEFHVYQKQALLMYKLFLYGYLRVTILQPEQYACTCTYFFEKGIINGILLLLFFFNLHVLYLMLQQNLQKLNFLT